MRIKAAERGLFVVCLFFFFVVNSAANEFSPSDLRTRRLPRSWLVRPFSFYRATDPTPLSLYVQARNVCSACNKIRILLYYLRLLCWTISKLMAIIATIIIKWKSLFFCFRIIIIISSSCSIRIIKIIIIKSLLFYCPVW